MKTKVSPAVVGLFVLGAMLLALVALFSFGGVNFFSRPQQFVVYFDESIHGLDLGSPVKLRGVRVGRVVELNLRYNPANNRSVVAVVCELNRNMITDEKGTQLDVTSRAEFQQLIDHGLRARLEIMGLATGLLYVELDFVDPEVYPAPHVDSVEVRYAVVPAMPSAISEFRASLTDILADLKRFDFPGLSKELRGLLVDARRQINAIETRELVAEWTKAAGAVQELVSSPELKSTFANLNAAATELRAVLTKIESGIDPASTKLATTMDEAQKALASFNAAAVTLRQFISAQQGLGDNSTRALAKLADAADAVQRLADFLERNPTALLSGRRPPPE